MELTDELSRRHPATEILALCKRNGWTLTELSYWAKISRKTLKSIRDYRCALTVDVALALEQFSERSAVDWMMLQRFVDLEEIWTGYCSKMTRRKPLGKNLEYEDSISFDENPLFAFCDILFAADISNEMMDRFLDVPSGGFRRIMEGKDDLSLEGAVRLCHQFRSIGLSAARALFRMKFEQDLAVARRARNDGIWRIERGDDQC